MIPSPALCLVDWFICVCQRWLLSWSTRIINAHQVTGVENELRLCTGIYLTIEVTIYFADFAECPVRVVHFLFNTLFQQSDFF